MKLKRAEAPAGANEAVAKFLVHTASAASPGPILLALETLKPARALAAWHPVFALPVQSGNSDDGGLAAAQPQGWRCLVLLGEMVVAAAEVAIKADQVTLITMLQGPPVAGTVAALAVAEALPGLEGAEYAPAMLRVPGRSLAALWLRAGEGVSEADRLILLADPEIAPVVLTPRDFMLRLARS